MANFLRREADSFFFRRRVPVPLQARLGQSEIYRSLKTTVRRVARQRAARLYLATESLFEMLSDDPQILSDADVRAAVRYWLDREEWQNMIGRYIRRNSPANLKNYGGQFPDLFPDLLGDERVPAWEKLRREAVWALEHAGYDGYHASEEEQTRTEEELKKQIREHVDRRMQELFGETTSAVHASVATSASELPTNMTKLSSFLDAWQKDIIAGYNHNKAIKDADQYLKTVEMFIGLMGDLPVGKITFETAAEFRELILQMPATHGKGGAASPKKELARAKADKSLPRVTMKTAKRHFSGMNSVWKWLIFKKHVPATTQPFSGHSFPGTKSKKSARDDWSREDLQRLFTSREYRDAPASSALHWLPLISLHSGMRLEEICRLRPATDIIVKDGAPCFDISPREGWDPKTESGTRIIPIHSWLIRHGIMDFVKQQRARGAEHLFSPELVSHKGSISSAFSREFSKLKINLGVGSKTTFHSFRHSFRTVLESTDLKESHIDAVMGHEGGGSEGRTYTKRVSTAKLRQVVEAFEPALDLAFLRPTSTDVPPPSPKVMVKKRKLVPPVLDENGRVVRRGKT
ncbi:site-specific integrase [Brucella anthropi]|uniref:site-specific integrase n=1 Tax=Brucella anthropi TaxID=529 RepID=UPI0003A581CB|nr:site-specific integrase [Brucella anthropi]